MPAPAATHPTRDTLAAFGSGKLTPTEAESVVRHLDDCKPCRDQAAAFSGDSFEARLKAARPAGLEVPPALAALNDYLVERLLGQGGMGAVYLARNLLMDRPEVLKVVNTAFLRKPGALERFQQEIRNAARLQHPNIVTAYSCLRPGDLLVFAMEYVDGKDLAQVVKDGGPLPVSNACYYAQQVARGLQHAHEKGMVHRDVKPANLMLAREGKRHVVKVLDFGLAKLVWDGGDAVGGDGDGPVDPGLTGAGRMLGTPDYISPEQTLDAARADIRADIYSLGCTLYFLLTGRPPFTAKSLAGILEAHHKTEARPLNLMRGDVPAELATVVAKMMAKDPARRYQTPLEVALALAPFVQGGGKAPVPAPPQAPELSTAEAPSRGSGDTHTQSKSSGSAPAIALTPVATPAPVYAPTPVATVIPQSTVPSPVVEVPPPPVWTDLATEPDAPAVRPVRRPKPRGLPVGLIAGGAVGVLLLGLVIAWAAGAFRVQTKDGTIVLENLPPDADVLVDGEKVTVSRNGDEARIFLTKAGKQGLKIVLDGKELLSKDVTVALGGDPIRIALEASVGGSKGGPTTPTLRFTPLFNGRDLSGWHTGLGERSQWSIESGILVARSAGALQRCYLISDEEYGDFVLKFDYLVESGGNGGVLLRASAGEKLPLPKKSIFDHPMIKLADPDRFLNFPTGTTHWIHNGSVDDKPQVAMTLPAGRWHRMEITVRGEACVALANGRPLVDVKLDPNPRSWRGCIPALKRTRGNVGFQGHTGTIRFREVAIASLEHVPDKDPITEKKETIQNPITEKKETIQNPITEKKVSPPPPPPMWTDLFTGKDVLDEWTKPESDGGTWKVENRELIGTWGDRASQPAVLLTKRGTFRNFHLRFEAYAERGADHRLLVRGLATKDRVSGYMLQLDGRPAAGSFARFDGDPPGALPPWQQPVDLGWAGRDQWTRWDVIVAGNRVVVRMNDKPTAHWELKNDPHPTGAIGLIAAGPVPGRYRNVQVRDLPGVPGAALADAGVAGKADRVAEIDQPIPFGGKWWDQWELSGNTTWDVDAKGHLVLSGRGSLVSRKDTPVNAEATVEVELAASADAEAWVGVRMKTDDVFADGQGMQLIGQSGKLEVGPVSHQLSAGKWTGSIRKVDPDEFIKVAVAVRSRLQPDGDTGKAVYVDTLTGSVNGAQTAAATTRDRVFTAGRVGLAVKRGKITIKP